MHVPEDRELRREFQDLGDRAREGAPPFDSLWDAVRARHASAAIHVPRAPHRVVVRRLAWAGALAALVIATTFYLRKDRLPSDQEALLMARQISAWNAPSDGWLRSRSAAVPSGVPGLSIESIPLPTDANERAILGSPQIQEVVQ